MNGAGCRPWAAWSSGARWPGAAGSRVTEGAAVRKGELILRIKPDNYQFQVEQQEASLAATKASAADSKSRLVKAESDFKRNQDLYNTKNISDSEYTAAVAAYESAKAGYESAVASISRAEGSLSHFEQLYEYQALHEGAPSHRVRPRLNSTIAMIARLPGVCNSGMG